MEIVVRFSSLKVFFVNSTESNTIEFNLRGASNAIFKFFLLNFLLNNELSFSLIIEFITTRFRNKAAHSR